MSDYEGDLNDEPIDEAGEREEDVSEERDDVEEPVEEEG